jgi:REP element-mobilizing transposase RayT
MAVPRPPRLQVAGGLYHVTAHSNVGRVVFRDDEERAQFLAMLEFGVTRWGWSCRSYCLLSTHFHLLIGTPEPDLSTGMQYVNGRYAQWANWHRGERSHVFEGRFRSVLVETESHALEVHRYIALNPVRASLVRDPEQWPGAACVPSWGANRRLPFSTLTRSWPSSEHPKQPHGDSSARSFVRGLPRTPPDRTVESQRLMGSDPRPGSGLIGG